MMGGCKVVTGLSAKGSSFTFCGKPRCEESRPYAICIDHWREQEAAEAEWREQVRNPPEASPTYWADLVAEGRRERASTEICVVISRQTFFVYFDPDGTSWRVCSSRRQRNSRCRYLFEMDLDGVEAQAVLKRAQQLYKVNAPCEAAAGD